MTGRIAFGVLAAAIVGAHVALWASDMPGEAKWRLTALNAAGWAVVLLGPAWLTSRWLRATRRRNAERRDEGGRSGPPPP